MEIDYQDELIDCILRSPWFLAKQREKIKHLKAEIKDLDQKLNLKISSHSRKNKKTHLTFFNKINKQ